jgi:hypothetical protein
VDRPAAEKTQWVYKFLKNVKEMYRKDPPSHILYCYGIHQDICYEMERSIPNFYSKQGLPTAEEMDEFTKDKRHELIIIDDLMYEVMKNKDMELLFTQCCHHKRVSVILIRQNLYPGGKHARTIALNTWYMVLMESIRYISQVAIFGRQLYPGKTKGFVKAYGDALSTKHGYILVDMGPMLRINTALERIFFSTRTP